MSYFAIPSAIWRAWRSWWVGGGIVILSLAAAMARLDPLGAVVIAVIPVSVFASIVVHEVAHAAMASLAGAPAWRVVVEGATIAIERPSAQSPAAERRIALAGPLVPAAFGLLVALVAATLGQWRFLALSVIWGVQVLSLLPSQHDGRRLRALRSSP